MNDNVTDNAKGEIQIVDDKPENLSLLSSMLKNHGYLTRMAINGELALNSIRAYPPDLILLDIMMPDISGYVVCEQLKADARTREIPIIFISALYDKSDKLKAFASGGVDYITKPFHEEEVLARVETHLSLRRMQMRLEAQNDLLQKEIDEHKRTEKARLDLQERLQKAHKSESLSRMAGAVAHHFNNLLFVISGNLELMRSKIPLQSDSEQYLDAAEGAVVRATEMGRLMLTYVGHDIGETFAHDFTEEVALIVPLITETLPSSVNLDCELIDHLPVVKIGSEDVRRIVENLVSNACEALDDQSGNVRIATGKMFCDSAFFNQAAWTENNTPGEYVYLQVTDDGCGMDRATMERMFDPFFSTKFTGRGLGLALVIGILRANRGVVTVSSEMGVGTVIQVLFPAAGQPQKTVKRPITLPSPKIPLNKFVLLAEDEKQVRIICRNMLRKIGFKVLSAKDGAEAVKLFRQYQNDIACVLCDLYMPQLNGWETLRAIREIRPDTPFILASGYDENTVMKGVHDILPSTFLHKPFKHADLEVTLCKVLGEGNARG